MAGQLEKPYIGVTGIAEVHQAQVITQAFIETGLTRENSSHQGMIGLLASKKTLRANYPGTSRHPSVDKIRQIFTTSLGSAFNTIHFNTYQEHTLSQQLGALLEPTGLYGDGLCQGVQVNVPWPPPRELERVRQMFPNLRIILQLGPRVLSENQPEEIIRHLANYRGLMDYSLIDPSGGRGTTFAADSVVPLYNIIRTAHPDLPMVFAGGFDAKNIRSRLWVLSRTIGTKDFSIDAEEGLRVRQERQPETILGTHRAAKYIRQAAMFLATN